MEENVGRGRSFLAFESNSNKIKEGDDESTIFLKKWAIPMPSKPSSSCRYDPARSPQFAHTNTRTPLLRSKHHQLSQHKIDSECRNEIIGFDDSDLLSTRHVFGESYFLSPRRETSHRDDHGKLVVTKSVESLKSVRLDGLAGWLFGFMYEDTYENSFDYPLDEVESNDAANKWNRLSIAIFISYALTTAATALPILLVPSVGQDFLADENEKSAFSSRAASSAVLGIACGKFLNGQVGDFLGARRTSSLYSILLAIALLGLALSQSETSATTACFYVEFFQSVQWPCIIVILGTHHNPPNNISQYESDIFLASVASRFGALIGIPIFSMLLRQLNWRLACLFGAWIATIGSSIMYLYVTDSPSRVNEPQNPLHPNLLRQLVSLNPIKNSKRCLVVSGKVLYSILANNVLPSFRHVFRSGTFWIVALAHTGSTMARTAERILGTYFCDTSFGYLSESQAGSLAIFLSLGTFLGLGIGGKLFTERKEYQRKLLVSRLYTITIIACYSLAILAIPRLRHFVDSPDLILFFQIVCSVCMGFGISVMYSIIPGLVGSSFGVHRGSYIAYTDGVAFGISSIVWKVVASAVANGNLDGGGWTYGWAAVALLMVLCAILMVEFMEHYFVRPSRMHNGTYETIILA